MPLHLDTLETQAADGKNNFYHAVAKAIYGDNFPHSKVKDDTVRFVREHYLALAKDNPEERKNFIETLRKAAIEAINLELDFVTRSTNPDPNAPLTSEQIKLYGDLSAKRLALRLLEGSAQEAAVLSYYCEILQLDRSTAEPFEINLVQRANKVNVVMVDNEPTINQNDYEDNSNIFLEDEHGYTACAHSGYYGVTSPSYPTIYINNQQDVNYGLIQQSPLKVEINANLMHEDERARMLDLITDIAANTPLNITADREFIAEYIPEVLDTTNAYRAVDAARAVALINALAYVGVNRGTDLQNEHRNGRTKDAIYEENLQFILDKLNGANAYDDFIELLDDSTDFLSDGNAPTWFQALADDEDHPEIHPTDTRSLDTQKERLISALKNELNKRILSSSQMLIDDFITTPSNLFQLVFANNSTEIINILCKYVREKIRDLDNLSDENLKKIITAKIPYILESISSGEKELEISAGAPPAALSEQEIFLAQKSVLETAIKENYRATLIERFIAEGKDHAVAAQSANEIIASPVVITRIQQLVDRRKSAAREKCNSNVQDAIHRENRGGIEARINHATRGAINGAIDQIIRGFDPGTQNAIRAIINAIPADTIENIVRREIDRVVASLGLNPTGAQINAAAQREIEKGVTTAVQEMLSTMHTAISGSPHTADFTAEQKAETLLKINAIRIPAEVHALSIAEGTAKNLLLKGFLEQFPDRKKLASNFSGCFKIYRERYLSDSDLLSTANIKRLQLETLKYILSDADYFRHALEALPLSIKDLVSIGDSFAAPLGVPPNPQQEAAIKLISKITGSEYTEFFNDPALIAHLNIAPSIRETVIQAGVGAVFFTRNTPIQLFCDALPTETLQKIANASTPEACAKILNESSILPDRLFDIAGIPVAINELNDARAPLLADRAYLDIDMGRHFNRDVRLQKHTKTLAGAHDNERLEALEEAKSAARDVLKRRRDPIVDKFLPYSYKEDETSNLLAVALSKRSSQNPLPLPLDHPDLSQHWKKLYNAPTKDNVREALVGLGIIAPKTIYPESAKAAFIGNSDDRLVSQIFERQKAFAIYDRINNPALARVLKRFYPEINFSADAKAWKKVEDLNNYLKDQDENWSLGDPAERTALTAFFQAVKPGLGIRLNEDTITALDNELDAASSEIQIEHQHYLQSIQESQKPGTESLKQQIRDERKALEKIQSVVYEKEEHNAIEQEEIKRLDIDYEPISFKDISEEVQVRKAAGSEAKAIAETFVKERLLDFIDTKAPANNGKPYDRKKIIEKWLKSRDEHPGNTAASIADFNDYMQTEYSIPLIPPFMTENDFNIIAKGNSLETAFLAGNIDIHIDHIRKSMDDELGEIGHGLLYNSVEAEWEKGLLDDETLKVLRTGVVSAKYLSDLTYNTGEVAADVLIGGAVPYGVTTATQAVTVGGAITKPVIVGAGVGAMGGPLGIIAGVAGGIVLGGALYAGSRYYGAKSANSTVKIDTYEEELEKLKTATQVGGGRLSYDTAAQHESLVNTHYEHFAKIVEMLDKEKEIIVRLETELTTFKAKYGSILDPVKAAIYENSVAELSKDIATRKARMEKHRGANDENYQSYAKWRDELKNIKSNIDRSLYDETGDRRDRKEALVLERYADQDFQYSTLSKSEWDRTKLYHGLSSHHTAGEVGRGLFTLTAGSPTRHPDLDNYTKDINEDEIRIKMRPIVRTDAATGVQIKDSGVISSREYGKDRSCIIKGEWITPLSAATYKDPNDASGARVIQWAPPKDFEPYDETPKLRRNNQTGKYEVEAPLDRPAADGSTTQWVELTTTEKAPPNFAGNAEHRKVLAQQVFDSVTEMLIKGFLNEKGYLPNKKDPMRIHANDPFAAQYLRAACLFYQSVFPELTNDAFVFSGRAPAAQPTMFFLSEKDKEPKEKAYFDHDKSSPEMQAFLEMIDYKRPTNIPAGKPIPLEKCGSLQAPQGVADIQKAMAQAKSNRYITRAHLTEASRPTNLPTKSSATKSAWQKRKLDAADIGPGDEDRQAVFRPRAH